MKQKSKALFWVLVFSFFWSFSIVIVKSLLIKKLNAFTILFQSQMVVVILSSIFLFFKKEKFKTITKKSLPWLLSFGTIGSGIGIGVSYIGLSLSTSVNYGFIIKTSAIFTVIIAHFWHNDEKINLRTIITSITFLFGIYLISTNGKLIVPKIGDLLILFGAMILGFSNNIVKILVKYKVDSYVMVFFRVLGGLIISVFFLIIFQNPFFSPEFFSFLFLNGISIALLMYATNKTIEYSSPSYLSMMSMIVPVIVTVFGVTIFGETIGIYQIVGEVIIIVSGIVLEKRRVKI